MNTTTTVAQPGKPQPAPTPAGHYGFGGILASEWTKLRSVRSTIWTLLITVTVGVGLGSVVASAQASRWPQRSPAAQANFDPTRSSLSGLLFAQLAIGVLGVLVMSAEYSTGSVRATFSAVPRRPLVLAAKAAVFGGLTVVAGEVTSWTAFTVGQQLLSGHTPTASLSDPDVVRAVLCGGLYLTLLGTLALGLASIIRHTPAAISTFVGALFILPIFSDVLPTSLAADIGRFLPADIGTVIMSAHYHGSDTFGPWTSLALLAGYATVALAIGTVLLIRRDA